jgi:hypothetical protein
MAIRKRAENQITQGLVAKVLPPALLYIEGLNNSMRTESTVHALVAIVSAVFEALPPHAQRRASVLIEDVAEHMYDQEAKALLDTFRP